DGSARRGRALPRGVRLRLLAAPDAVHRPDDRPDARPEGDPADPADAPTLVLPPAAGTVRPGGAAIGTPPTGARRPVRRRVAAGALLAALLTAIIATAATIGATTAGHDDRVPVPEPSAPASEPPEPTQATPEPSGTTEPSDDDAPGNSGTHRNDDKGDKGDKEKSGKGGD
ncbi:hypothetical protein ACWKWP_10225, partial [Agromyces soli]